MQGDIFCLAMVYIFGHKTVKRQVDLITNRYRIISTWMSVKLKMGRKLLKRTSFSSKKQLRRELRAFIRYFNKTMAKPFNWTSAGKPLSI